MVQGLEMFETGSSAVWFSGDQEALLQVSQLRLQAPAAAHKPSVWEVETASPPRVQEASVA